MKAEAVKEKRTADRIVEAATALFARRGYAAVSVKELAKEAGVNIALISYYFGGKEKLYTVVLERQFAILAEVVDSVNQEGLCPLEKIRRFASLLIEVQKKTAYLDQLIFGEKINPTGCLDKVLKREVARVHCFLRDCISEAMDRGYVRADLDPDYAAVALGGILRSYFCMRPFVQPFLSARDDQAEYYISQAVEIYLRGVLCAKS